MRVYLWLGLCFLLLNKQTIAQKDSVIAIKPLLSKLIVPTSLILSGVLLTGSQSEKNWQIDIRNKVGNDYYNKLDDYIQYVPYAQIYLGDVVGIKAKNHWFDQTKNIFLAYKICLTG